MTVASDVAMYNDLDNVSADDVIVRYAPLVKRIAHHIMARMPASVQVEDLIQAGLVGLLEASRNYDVSKGASFETYAGIRIRGSMIDDVRRGDWVPRSVHRNARRVAEAIQTIEKKTGRDASDNEVAQALEVDMDTYYHMLQDASSSKLFSFDEITSGQDRTEEQVAGSDLDPFEDIEVDAMRKNLAEAIGQLPERERLVLALYYDEELNLKEIGQILDVSESRVSQIHSQAALRLRSRLSHWREQEPA